MKARKATVYQRGGRIIVDRVDTTVDGIPVATDDLAISDAGVGARELGQAVLGAPVEPAPAFPESSVMSGDLASSPSCVARACGRGGASCTAAGRCPCSRWRMGSSSCPASTLAPGGVRGLPEEAITVAAGDPVMVGEAVLVRSTRPNRRADHAMSRQSRPGPNKGPTIGASAPSHAQQCRSPHTGTSDTVVRIANTGGTGAVTDSIPDPAGDRLGTKTGSTVAWLTPDLHGSIAAGLAQTPSAVTDAIRYDGYGQTVAVWPSGGSAATTSWKYQGRLDLSPSSIPLYAAGARDYAPGLGMFTSLDTFAGSAQDPLHEPLPVRRGQPGHAGGSERTLHELLVVRCRYLEPVDLLRRALPARRCPAAGGDRDPARIPQAAMAIGLGDLPRADTGTVVGAYQLYQATTNPAPVPRVARDLLRSPRPSPGPGRAVRGSLSTAAFSGGRAGHMHDELTSGNAYDFGSASADVTVVADAVAGGVGAARGAVHGLAGLRGAAAGRDVADAATVRAIAHGESLMNLASELKERTFTTRLEHAIVSYGPSRAAIVSGGRGGITCLRLCAD